MNGCVAVEWSNTLAAGKKNGKYFKYGATQMVVSARSLAAIARNYVTGKTTSTTDTTTKSDSANTEKTEELEKPSTTQPTKATTTTQPSMPTPEPEPKQDGIINWFKNWFKRLFR